MIDLPANPVDGQEYTLDGRTWVWAAGVGGGAVGAWNMKPVSSGDANVAAAAASAANASRLAAAASAAAALASQQSAAATLAGAVKTADIGAVGTVAIGGFSAAQAQAILDNGMALADIAALRANTSRATGISLKAPGVFGAFYRDDADTTSADNGGWIIVDAAGKRWKRIDTVVRPEHFAALGVADDTANWQKALDFAALAGMPLVVSRPHVINGALSNVTGKDVSIRFESGAYLDGTGSAAATLLTIGGSLGTPQALFADVSKGARSIGVAGTTLVRGDVVRIQSTDLWNPTRPQYVKGEMARVFSVSGDTITLDNPLYDSYPAATTTVTKYNMGRAILENIDIRRNGANAGMYLQYARDFRVTSPRISGANERCLYLLECFNGTVDSATLTGSWYTGGGTNYGLSVASCQHLKVQGGYFVGGRHGIATGGTFPVRDARFDDCTVDNDPAGSTYCLDTHGNGEFLVFQNCHVMNAAMLQSINTRVCGGEYRSFNYAAAALGFIPEIGGDYLEAVGVYAQNFAGLTGILVSLYSDALTFNSVDISDCTAIGESGINPSTGQIAVRTNNGAWTGTIRKINISKAKTRMRVAPASTAYGIAVGVGGLITGNLSVTDSDVGSVVSPGRSMYYRLNGRTVSRGNVYRGYHAADYSGVLSAGGDVSATDDRFEGNGAALYVISTTTGRVKMVDCHFEGMNSNGGFATQNAVDVMTAGLTRANTTGQPAHTHATPYSALSSANQRTFYRNAIPVLGTFVAGDITVNTPAVVGQPKGWRCTVGGVNAAATWVSEGNL